MEQGTGRQPAHEERRRQPNADSPRKALEHDKHRVSMAVEAADKAEQEAGQQAVDGIGLQVFPGSGNDRRILGKKARQQVPVEKRRPAHQHSRRHRGSNTAPQGFSRPVPPVRAHILGHEGGHGLHVGGGHQHDEGAQLLRHAHAGGGDGAHGVGDGDDGQEGEVHQQILEGHWTAQPQDLAGHSPVKAKVLACQCKGQLLPSDDQQGQHHTDRLGKHRGNGGPRHA